MSEEKQEKKKSNVGVLVVLIMVGLLAFCAISQNTYRKEQAKEREQERINADAYRECQPYVKREMGYPSNIEFPDLDAVGFYIDGDFYALGGDVIADGEYAWDCELTRSGDSWQFERVAVTEY